MNLSVFRNFPLVSLEGQKDGLTALCYCKKNIFFFGKSSLYIKRNNLRGGALFVWPSYSFVKGANVTMLHHVLNHIGDLHLVLPALNLSILDADILIMVQQVRLMMFLLNMVDYPMSFLYPLAVHLGCFWWTIRGDHSKMVLLFEFGS